jgi:amidohydrolase
LPLEEQSGLSFAAKKGLHHACGHDGHMAVMLSTISIISRERADLKKKVVFCFQPGEEGK